MSSESFDSQSPNNSITTVDSDNLNSPQMRKEYLRRAITVAQNLRECAEAGSNAATLNNLEEVIQQVDMVEKEASIDEKIDNQEEIFLDSEVMNLSSRLFSECTTGLTRKMKSCDYVDFAEKLMSLMLRMPDTVMDECNWSLLEARIIPEMFIVPKTSSLLGSLQPLERKVAQRQATQRQSQKPKEMKSPEKMKTVATEENSVDQTVEKIRSLITQLYRKQRKPIDYFLLVLHPTDFSKTVENILYISFLVRDGVAKMTFDESGRLVILPCSKDSDKHSETVQNMLDISMQQWKELNAAYKIKKPTIDF